MSKWHRGRTGKTKSKRNDPLLQAYIDATQGGQHPDVIVVNGRDARDHWGVNFPDELLGEALIIGADGSIAVYREDA